MIIFFWFCRLSDYVYKQTLNIIFSCVFSIIWLAHFPIKEKEILRVRETKFKAR